ncbi:hypothetical protein BA184_05565 [Helicobacter pullorum]|nr:hypothetical protein BA729_03215 [Helicobacter pullorum]OCR07340.1 hypothetical protein BA185_04670 [Helicobacter pullorum]OCR09897.1 hypothetical protein BA184_05565 [Helicobacter pullorum]OCR12236.1 hypothetical protein BA730_05945 [Helicobacter pullorum]
MGLMLLQTTTTSENAKILISRAMESGFVSCVQRMAIESYYFWEEKLNCEEEILLTFKVDRKNFKNLKALIAKNHIYEIPEIIGISLRDVSKSYKKWHEKVIKAHKKGL